MVGRKKLRMLDHWDAPGTCRIMLCIRRGAPESGTESACKRTFRKCTCKSLSTKQTETSAGSYGQNLERTSPQRHTGWPEYALVLLARAARVKISKGSMTRSVRPLIMVEPAESS
ncbi:interleukin-17 receptor E [Trichinella spiralis]|uniref:interleukin-17 receptor E n=1 Tax=Trichinella spiralis TaxID=6334 RepID=UPI0001EFE943|nr:interleukin-17 receptor E [Trichinella spiralis]